MDLWSQQPSVAAVLERSGHAQVLRDTLNCTLPIEIIYNGPLEMDAWAIHKFEARACSHPSRWLFPPRCMRTGCRVVLMLCREDGPAEQHSLTGACRMMTADLIRGCEVHQRGRAAPPRARAAADQGRVAVQDRRGRNCPTHAPLHNPMQASPCMRSRRPAHMHVQEEVFCDNPFLVLWVKHGHAWASVQEREQGNITHIIGGFGHKVFSLCYATSFDEVHPSPLHACLCMPLPMPVLCAGAITHLSQVTPQQGISDWSGLPAELQHCMQDIKCRGDVGKKSLSQARSHL